MIGKFFIVAVVGIAVFTSMSDANCLQKNEDCRKPCFKKNRDELDPCLEVCEEAKDNCARECNEAMDADYYNLNPMTMKTLPEMETARKNCLGISEEK